MEKVFCDICSKEMKDRNTVEVYDAEKDDMSLAFDVCKPCENKVVKALNALKKSVK